MPGEAGVCLMRRGRQKRRQGRADTRAAHTITLYPSLYSPLDLCFPLPLHSLLLSEYLDGGTMQNECHHFTIQLLQYIKAGRSHYARNLLDM